MEPTQTQPIQEKPKKKSRARNPQRKVSAEKFRPRQKRTDPDMDETELVRVNGTNYAPSNPYRANQWIKDPRQDIMWEIYMKQWNKGINPSAKQAALDAGYSDTTAINVTNFPWFKERFDRLKRKDMLSKAERNLDKILDLDYSKLDAITGEIGVDIDKLKIVADISKMTATTLGKDEGYSAKTTLDQKVSGEVQIRAVSYADAIIEAPKEAEVIEAPAEEIHV